MGAWDGVVKLRAEASLGELAARIGGVVHRNGTSAVVRLAPIEAAGEGDLAPLLSGRYAREAKGAAERGAAILATSELATRVPASAPLWTHAHATWALAALLDECDAADDAPAIGEGTIIGLHAVIAPRVVVGRNVTIGAGAVLGGPGFGWATAPDGRTRRIPQLGGVVIEDDVAIGPLCTIDAGTLSPTRIRRGAKLDAHVHVGHNVEIGEGTLVAAQVGFAGSVRVGKGVLVGGQAGLADHVRVGDGARIAAKSGVIGDVPAGSVVAGYPAVARGRWLRGVARLLRP